MEQEYHDREANLEAHEVVMAKAKEAFLEAVHESLVLHRA